jgi:hypothetical protein
MGEGQGGGAKYLQKIKYWFPSLPLTPSREGRGK